MPTCDKLHRLTERDIRLAHYFALDLFWGLGLRLGYLRCFPTPFPIGRRNFARISRSFGDLTRDRQIDDRRQMRRPEGSYSKCASLTFLANADGDARSLQSYILCAITPKFHCFDRPTLWNFIQEIDNKSTTNRNSGV